MLLHSFKSICIKKVKSEMKRIGTYKNHQTEEKKIVVYTKQPSIELCLWTFKYYGLGVALHIS